MAESKTLRLIKSLSPDERIRFRETIEQKRNGRMRKLFDCFVPSPNAILDPLKEALFVTLWEQPYTTEKDYLLRNELRHLNQTLNAFLTLAPSSTPAADNLEQDLHTLRELSERGEKPTFEKEFRCFVRKAQKQDDPESLATAWRIYTSLLATQAPTHIRECKAALSIAQESFYWQRRAALRIQLSEWVHIGYFQRILHALGDPVPPLPDLQSFDPETLSPTDHYLLRKGQYYQPHTRDRKAILLEMQTLLDQSQARRFPVAQEKVWLAGALGLEAYLERDYNQACTSFEQLLRLPEAANHPRNLGIRFNYLSSLLKLGRYPLALDRIHAWDIHFLEASHLADRYRCLKAMTLLFNDRLDQALHTLQDHVSHTNSDTYLYFRLICAIVHYLRGNLTVALQEIQNFNQGTHSRQGIRPYYLTIGKHLERWIKLACDKPGLPNPEFQERTARALADIENCDLEVRDILLTQWLQEEIIRTLNPA